VRWAYYATLASPLKAAVAFGVRDIRQLRNFVGVRNARPPWALALRKPVDDHGCYGQAYRARHNDDIAFATRL
jgi:hypothetical protein